MDYATAAGAKLDGKNSRSVTPLGAPLLLTQGYHLMKTKFAASYWKLSQMESRMNDNYDSVWGIAVTCLGSIDL